ncbi:MAG: CxxxxCH/CxxCH domain-containing protein [Bacteroidetes bacterium]|nr:CxxxxCH/CxxCH domain-containing protein [Bacteroidota bacterium]
MRTRMNHLSLIRLAAVALTLAVLTGCADLQEQLPPATTAGANVHPDGWNVPAASTFHGKHIRANGWEMTSCQQCHGALNSTNGGTSGVSCATCHSQPAGPNDCTTCHGGVNAAPPRDLDGTTTVTSPGVGAHQFHLASMTTGKLVQCAECHTVPAATADSGHIDASLPAEVPMNGAIVRTARSGVTPSPAYSFTNNTCGGTYCHCHGSFKNGNLTNAPTWNAPAGTGAACGTCHGNTAASTTPQKALPKTAAGGGTHPNYTQCVWCHDQTVNASASIVDASKHVDGTIQIYPYGGSFSCRHCHGSTNASPPVDLAGNTDRTAPGVGAHQIHRAGGALGKAVACTECHISPSGLDYTGADGHMDGAPNAELVFGPLAGKDTLGVTSSPTYSFTTRKCSDSYCHGSFKNGNPTNAPVWNGAAGTGAECGTCHGNTLGVTVAAKALPKNLSNGGTHPNDTRCSLCHAEVVNASASITSTAKHINGQIEVFQYTGPQDCNVCHGSATNAAPPNDLDGNSVRTSPGVGAHQVHVAGTSTAATVACAECHTVPTTLDYSGADGHLDAAGGSAELLFGALARKTTSGCHGSFKNGNLTNAPTWNAPAGTGAACGTCHGNTAGGTTAQKALPKTAANGGTHPNYTQCSMCHDQVVNASTNFVDRTKHLDGINQVYPYGGSADCSHCHGSAANAAPPKDIAGNSSTSARGVGAHQVHLLATTAKQVKCAECHTVPATLDYSGADGHMEGTALAEVAMNDTLASVITTVGSTTTQIIPNPTYNPADQSCSNTYCHGTFDYGNPSNAPTWTNAASGNCGTCHGNPATGNPLPPPPHSTNQNCGICHTFSGEPPIATYNSVAGTWSITNAKRHINGKRNTFTTEGPY